MTAHNSSTSAALEEMHLFPMFAMDAELALTQWLHGARPLGRRLRPRGHWWDGPSSPEIHRL